jgi:nifR3 family TIM-barrel protein
MFRVGETKIKSKVILAPMAGFTSYAYRKFMAPFGVGLFYTEMVSDAGYLYNNKETIKYLPQEDDVRPLALQLFGGKEEQLISAIEKLEKSDYKYDILDINLACPMPKVTRNNGGAAWLRKEEELLSMLEKVVKVSTRPVSVKLRIGWDENSINIRNLLPKIEKVGVSLIAVHLRTAKQMYTLKARYDLAANLGDLVQIPLIISGDIYTLEDAINALEITKADGVMVARGGLGNPHLIRQIDQYFKTGKVLPPSTLDKQLEYLEQLALLLVEEKGEQTGISCFRGIGPHFLKGFPGLKKYRIELTQNCKKIDDILNLIKRIKIDFDIK